MRKEFKRTCQECGYKLITPTGPGPGAKVTDAYIFRKCPKCKSEAFDYGSYQMIAETPEEQKELDDDY
jgi:predicted nucleic-acid-binding Zn-ribbon protein